MLNTPDLLKIAVEAAIKGGREILDVYHHDFDVEYKQDKSPLTEADKRSHRAISELLAQTGLPVLSEEGKSISYEVRQAWDRFWLVDPLDGTKEFVKRNGEFTVNIALVINGKPEMGIIFIPVTGVLYFASFTSGARKIKLDELKEISFDKIMQKADILPQARHSAKMTVVCSRSHMSPETEAYIDGLRNAGHDIDFVSIGSSLKLCLVAEGKADIYPRFGPTMEWDTAAGQAIAEISGCSVLIAGTSETVSYNKPDLLNPWFIVSRK